ncbi:hypothetical protein [Streptomyces sp. NPDC045470]|uniref:hypothetical protein n=1 Tax=Streptomyces sp. NPDC045470 TaxID=3155469 RepID=UPI0033EE74BD
MRDSIARALLRVLAVFLPAARRRTPGRHSAAYLADRLPVDLGAHIHLTPWPTPEPEHVTARREPLVYEDSRLSVRPYALPDEATLRLHRRIALRLATEAPEREYPYTYPGAPFPASAFTTPAVSA